MRVRKGWLLFKMKNDMETRNHPMSECSCYYHKQHNGKMRIND